MTTGDGSTMHEQGTVLVVDDEAPQRNITIQNLKRGGLDVVSAKNEEEAYEHVVTGRIALCLLDVKMGDNDKAGVELMLGIRSKIQDMPVIFITGYDMSMTIDYPHIETVRKPLTQDVYRELILKIQALIRNRCRDQHIAQTRKDMGEMLPMVRATYVMLNHPTDGLQAIKTMAESAHKRDLGTLIVEAVKQPMVWGLVLVCGGLFSAWLKAIGVGH